MSLDTSVVALKIRELFFCNPWRDGLVGKPSKSDSFTIAILPYHALYESEAIPLRVLRRGTAQYLSSAATSSRSSAAPSPVGDNRRYVLK